MDDIRADREVRRSLIISDPLPVDSVNSMWVSAGHGAIIGIFLLLFGAFLYFGRPILLPVLAAAVLALTLAPLIKSAKRFGIPTWVTAILILLIGFGGLSFAAMALAKPVSEWIARAPEIGASIKDKLAVLDQPLAALQQLETSLFGDSGALKVNASGPNVVLPVVAFVTPAAGELVLFFTTLLFFLVGQIELRNQAVALFGSKDSKLRFLKIMRDIERNLVAYLTVVTIVNVGIGLVTFPSLAHALIAPLGLIALTTLEGHLITPTLVGRRLTLNPLVLFLALAFWTWMWGPMGALLAAPLSIIGLVVVNHLFPPDDVRLPE